MALSRSALNFFLENQSNQDPLKSNATQDIYKVMKNKVSSNSDVASQNTAMKKFLAGSDSNTRKFLGSAQPTMKPDMAGQKQINDLAAKSNVMNINAGKWDSNTKRNLNNIEASLTKRVDLSKSPMEKSQNAKFAAQIMRGALSNAQASMKPKINKPK